MIKTSHSPDREVFGADKIAITSIAISSCIQDSSTFNLDLMVLTNMGVLTALYLGRVPAGMHLKVRPCKEEHPPAALRQMEDLRPPYQKGL